MTGVLSAFAKAWASIPISRLCRREKTPPSSLPDLPPLETSLWLRNHAKGLRGKSDQVFECPNCYEDVETVIYAGPSMLELAAYLEALADAYDRDLLAQLDHARKTKGKAS